MPSIMFDSERIRAFTGEPDDGPIVMINLLRFRERAEYPAGFDATPCSGEEAYARYAEAVFPLLRARGAKLVWRGRADGVLIGPADESWDDALLVEYPERSVFVGMVTSPEYRAILPHRNAALADSRLIATRTTAP